MTAIYIFEPSEKRLVAIDKASGNIIKQYTNPLWQSPADVLIDQDKNTAYVLDSNIVYKFTL
jgi:DNA-binding beta-propeller fold protein YncE